MFKCKTPLKCLQRQKIITNIVMTSVAVAGGWLVVWSLISHSQ